MATTTTPPASTPPADTPPAAKGTFTDSVAVDKTLRSTVARRGLRYRVRCSAACTVKVAVRIDAKTARALGMRSRIVGTSTLHITKAGRTTRRVKLHRDVRRRILAAKRAKLSLKTTIVTGRHHKTSVHRIKLAGAVVK